jgi:hypothetical protein
VYAAGLRGGQVDREVEQSVAGRLDGHGVERVASGLQPRLGSAEIPPRTANELQRKIGLLVIPRLDVSAVAAFVLVEGMLPLIPIVLVRHSAQRMRAVLETALGLRFEDRT